MEKIGDLSEIEGEIKFEWKIKNFSLLSHEKNIWYESPTFYFSGTSWVIWIFPNGETTQNSDGWMSLFLGRMSTGFPVTVDFSFSFKTLHGNLDLQKTYTKFFDKKIQSWGTPKVILRSNLMERKSDLLPSDTLTVICTLKNTETKDVSSSLFRRLQEMSDNFKEAYAEGTKTDFTLKADGGNICAHQMILETRSPVFCAMLNHNTIENATSEIPIPDIDKSTMESILMYMYTGDLDEFTAENALSLYAAADKYDLKAIKNICSDFIVRNLSVEWICDVIKFAELYEEEEIYRRAREYFKENAGAILETDKWKTFAKENHDIGVELLSTVVKKLLQK